MTWSRMTLVVVSVGLVAGCQRPASDEAATTTASNEPSTLAGDTAAATTTVLSGVNAGTHVVNGHELYLECRGSGEPTFVFESGEGSPISEGASLAAQLADRGTICLYDRANKGRSGSAPTPRTVDDIASDLGGLLDAAGVGGPLVFIGQSAGGMFVQLYPSYFGEDVAAVFAMNPVPPYEEWFDQVVSKIPDQAREEEAAYYAGANGESLDYQTSSSQIDQAGPTDVPFILLLSTIAQCEGPEDPCTLGYPVYETIMRQLAESWPAGEFVQFEAGHLLPADDIVGEVDRVLETLGMSR